MSSLTPEQVELQQQLVVEHVNKQADEQHLNSVQKAELLAQTLAHNNLPAVSSPVDSNNLTNSVVSSVSQGESFLSSIISSFMGQESNHANPNQHEEQIPGLPVPGTLQHTITLALFRAQQAMNKVLKPAQEVDKIGLAEGESDSGGGFLITVGNAASSLVKFISPPASKDAASSDKPGLTYSQVTSGPDPAYAALGLLTTGALGTVLYTYVASDENLASSATALAKGAVDAIKRNDIVQAATGALSSVAGSVFDEQSDPGKLNYDIVYNNEYNDYAYEYSNRENGETDNHEYSNSYGDYRDYSEGVAHSIPENTDWFDPMTGEVNYDNPSYITYEEEHSPWETIRTDHLYH